MEVFGNEHKITATVQILAETANGKKNQLVIQENAVIYF